VASARYLRAGALKLLDLRPDRQRLRAEHFDDSVDLEACDIW
jgi:hypothetical protein